MKAINAQYRCREYTLYKKKNVEIVEDIDACRPPCTYAIGAGVAGGVSITVGCRLSRGRCLMRASSCFENRCDEATGEDWSQACAVTEMRLCKQGTSCYSRSERVHAQRFQRPVVSSQPSTPSLGAHEMAPPVSCRRIFFVSRRFRRCGFRFILAELAKHLAQNVVQTTNYGQTAPVRKTTA